VTDALNVLMDMNKIMLLTLKYVLQVEVMDSRQEQKSEMMETQRMEMDVQLIDLQLKQAGSELEEVQPIMTLEHFDHQAGIKTMRLTLKHELVGVVMAKKLVQKNETMEIRMMMMGVLVTDLQLKLAGSELEEAQLYQTHVLFVLQAGTKITQPILKHELVSVVMDLKLELRFVMTIIL
jgi:hypothetical protein